MQSCHTWAGCSQQQAEQIPTQQPKENWNQDVPEAQGDGHSAEQHHFNAS